MTEQTTPAPAPSPRRTPIGWRILKWTGIVLVSLVVLGAVLLYLPFTRQWAFDYGRSILAEAGVQSDGISGDWTEMTLTNVALTDDEGTWATANEVILAWSPWGLIGGTLHATRVEFRGARLIRNPAYAPDPDQADEPFAWPDLPVDVTLDSLIGDVTLDPSILGEPVTAAVAGKAALTGAGGNAELSLNRTDGVAGEAAITAASDNELRNVEIAINAKDARLAALLAGDERLQNVEIAFQAARQDTVCSGQAAISARDGPLATLGVNPNCTFAVTLPQVEVLAGPKAGIIGPATVSVQLLEDGTDQTTHLNIAADLSKLQSSDAMIARLLPGASATTLVRFTAGGIRLDNLAAQVAGGTVTLTGNVAQEGDALSAALDIGATNLTALRDDLAGQLQATLRYDTAAATPIQFTAKGQNVASGGLAWKVVDASGAVDMTGSGTVIVKADGAAPIDLTTKIADAFGARLNVETAGTVAGAAISAKAVAAGDGYAVNATLDTQRLENLGAIAGVDVAGAFKANVSGTVGGTIGDLNLEASIARGRYGATEIGDATLTAKGPLSALAIDLKGRAPLAPRIVDYRVVATVTDFASARITTLRAASADEAIETSAPFTVAFADVLTVTGLDARVTKGSRAAGRITADVSQGPAGFKTNARLSAVDLEAVMAILGRDPVRGTVELTANLDGGAGRATLDGTITGLRVGGSAGRAPPANITLKGNWNGGRFTLGATAVAEGLPNATAEIAFPMARAAGGGVPSPAPNAPLTGRVAWNGALAPLWRLADVGGQDLQGDAAINATIGGTLSNPAFSGTVALTNGRYLNDALGTRLEALTLNARLDGQNVSVEGRATDGRNGRLTINAAANLSGGLGAVSGGVTLSRMQLIARDDLVAGVDGSLKLAATATGPALTGALTITGVEASIPESGPADLVVVDVIDPDKPQPKKPANAAPAPAASGPSAPANDTLALDIDVNIPVPAKVGGRGIDSIWGGRLHVFGDATDARVEGKIELARGTLAFGSRTFDLTEGLIEFDGGPSLEPRIKIVATQEEDDFTASLTIAGRASDPKISVSSTPAAPQDEVFARLLFGRSVANLSPLEGLELANSVAQLSGGIGGGPGVLSSIRDRFGLDVLSVDVGEGGDTTVKAGSYLTDNVYFELRQGGAQGGTKGVLELEIDENLSVETEVGADSSSAVGAKYRYDY